MHSPCGPPKFDEQDWSKFDFSRWHLDGLTLDAAAVAFASLSEKLFQSEEWRQHFQATRPELEREALNFYKGHSRELQDQKTAAAQDFDNRIVAAQRRSDDFRKFIEAATAPPVLQPSSDTYHLAVKVTTEDVPLGLPGLAVQMMDPRDQKTALVQATTDRDGNTILTIPSELAKELDKRDTALEVLAPSGKALAKLPGSVCVRLNQVETKVVTLPNSKEIEPHKSAAAGIRSEREARVASLAARTELLRREREARLQDLDCRLADNQAIIAELEKTEPAARASESAKESAESAPDDAEPRQTEPSKEEPRPGPKKGRKKS